MLILSSQTLSFCRTLIIMIIMRPLFILRLRRGLDPVTGDDVTSGTMEAGGDDQFQAAAMRSNSFDVAPSGYIAPTVAWFTGLLLPEFEGQQRCAGGDTPEPNNKNNGRAYLDLRSPALTVRSLALLAR